jgi:hypothetical protein
MRKIGFALIVVAIALGLYGVARAQWFGWQSTKGSGTGGLSTIYCALTGCTMTGNLTVQGSTALGNSVASDTLAVSATVTHYGPVDFNGSNLIMDADGDLTCRAAVDDTLACDVNTGMMTICNGACPSWGSAPQFAVEGAAEIDGSANFHGYAYFSSYSFFMLPSYHTDGIKAFWGDGDDFGIFFNTAQTNDAVEFNLNTSGSNSLLIGPTGTANQALSVQANPTLYLFAASATNATSHYLSLTHDQTNGVIDVGTGSINLAASTIVSGQISTTVPATSTPTGTTQTIDWATGNVQVLDLGSASGNVTLTFSNPASGAAYILKVIQGATARTLTFPAAVLWESGADMVLTSTEDAVDIASCTYVGSNYLCNYGSDYK